MTHYIGYGVPHLSSQFLTPHPTLFHYFLLAVSSCLYVAAPAIPSLKVRSLVVSWVLSWIAVTLFCCSDSLGVLLKIPVCCFLGCGLPVSCFALYFAIGHPALHSVCKHSQRQLCIYIKRDLHLQREIAYAPREFSVIKRADSIRTDDSSFMKLSPLYLLGFIQCNNFTAFYFCVDLYFLL